MRRLAVSLVLLAAAGIVGILDSGAADVFLEATRPDFQKIPVGVLGFQDGTVPTHPGNQAAEVLKADLRRSQIFTISDVSKLGIKPEDVNDPQKVAFQRAMDNGVTAMVWGNMTMRNPDMILDGYLYDGAKNEGLMGKRYVGSPTVLRQMVHRLSDELVFRYTGEQGIARTKIAFVGELNGGGREIYLMDYDGFGPRQVTADAFINLMPRWSPDRRYLVFTTYRSRNKQDIDSIELATGKRSTLVDLPGLNITPSYSPDGRLLAFSTSRDGNSEIYTLDVRDRSFKRLTADSAGDLSPSWAPTGRELVFVSDRGGGPQIYLMSADGSNVRRLTFEGDYNAAPAWSPRGTWIAYVCRTVERQYKLCLISPDGQKRLQITTGTAVDDSPSWSPDGRHLVFSSTSEGKSHLYMVNADGTELERLTSGGMHHSSPSWSPS